MVSALRLMLLIVAAVAAIAPVALAEELPLPNIVVMLADDMGLGDTSAYRDVTGNEPSVQLNTPQMERLARLGVRFTDAHTPSSRCTTTRYSLLTGRYSWRSRLKHWVLFGAQGDPLIERGRPTLATMLKEARYGTYMVGKWHVGLRYRQTDGRPAAGWDDAELAQPLYDSPLDHGFDACWITSRSHGTSGPNAERSSSPDAREPRGKGKAKAAGANNSPRQSVGPGHIHGRRVVDAQPGTKQLREAANAYRLSELGARHSDHAVEMLDRHVAGESTTERPFFLYYASNSNHSPYTPAVRIGDRRVRGGGRSVAGESLGPRADFVYENDVALGRLLDYLRNTPDPRRPGHALLDNTLVIFTSDNGAERLAPASVGPNRSNKGSAYEGGHRVPFIAAWPAGRVGDGDAERPGATNASLIGLQDLFATFAEMTGQALPDLLAGEIGAEDSVSFLKALLGEQLPPRPMFFNDHREAEDPAACALRFDVEGSKSAPELPDGKWKLFCDAGLLRRAAVKPLELYDLDTDSREASDRLAAAELGPLVTRLEDLAWHHRRCGHRLAEQLTAAPVVQFDLASSAAMAGGTDARRKAVSIARGEMQGQHRWRGLAGDLELELTAVSRADKSEAVFAVAADGLGVGRDPGATVESGEGIELRFNRDVLIEWLAMVAGEGQCGGFCIVGDRAPLAIYCVDADVDARDQSGVMSDLGVLKAGQTLRLSADPHLGVEASGRWRLGSISVRVCPAAGK